MYLLHVFLSLCLVFFLEAGEPGENRPSIAKKRSQSTKIVHLKPSYTRFDEPTDRDFMVPERDLKDFYPAVWGERGEDPEREFHYESYPGDQSELTRVEKHNSLEYPIYKEHARGGTVYRRQNRELIYGYRQLPKHAEEYFEWSRPQIIRQMEPSKRVKRDYFRSRGL